MVMELLDRDLGTLFKRRDQRFSFDTVCLIAVQILSRSVFVSLLFSN